MKKARKVMVVILAIVFAVSLGHLIRNAVNYRAGADNYSSAQEIAGITETPEEQPEVEEEEVVDPLVKALRSVDLAALQAVNPEVKAWIHIPDTVISYPVMYGTDNDYYLKHTWDNQKNIVGSIFIDYRVNGDLSDFNTLIHGHNMRDDSMFGSLHSYKEAEFLTTHPDVYLVTEQGCYKYRIFSTFMAKLTTAEPFQMEFEGDEDKLEFINDCQRLGNDNTGIVVTPEDHVITLSTCSSWGHNYRWVVQAVLDTEFTFALQSGSTKAE